MTNQEKLLSYVILGISKGLLGEFDEVPDESSSTKTATRLAELTKATEVVVEHQLALDNRLARLEDELRALRADLKEYTLIAAMRTPAAAEPTPASQSMPRTTNGAARVEEVESRELQQIDNALAQMEAGTYGICEITGKEIPIARLEALPYVTTTIEAQRMIEENGGRANFTPDWSRMIDSPGDDTNISINDIEYL